MYDRMLAEAATRGRDEQEDKAIIEKELKKEQQRIENELMTFELDLWEY